MDWLLNIFRKIQRWWFKRKFLRSSHSEASEEFLEIVLKLMRLSFKIDRGYRRNIEGFTGKIQFRTRNDSVTVAAIFDGKQMHVREKLVDDPNVTVVFKDARSMMDYLLTMNRDILKLVLNNEVALKGNTNYMLKFGYMANHLQLALTGDLP
ncbi:hypothetical protein ACFLX5_04105 [Chloroflexota bacterium]